MKILYALQGTGNGHLTRATDIYPELIKYGDVEVLISGVQTDIKAPFPIAYQYHGLGFMFGHHGGIDVWKTIRNTRLPRLLRDIRHLPVEKYDLVINDFEAVSAWACKLKGKHCVSLSHQSAVLHKDAPKPDAHDFVGELVLQQYAPVSRVYGFHFNAFADNIFTPVIRQKIRDTVPVNKGHYTVYLPAYDDKKLVLHLSKFKQVQWQVFSKHNKKPFSFENIQVQPVENEAFINSMASSAGVLCGAGFEGPAEALYLGKKLLVIPMQNQYEQQCNAAALKEMGVPVISLLANRYHSVIERWLNDDKLIKVNYPDMTADVIARVVRENSVPYHDSATMTPSVY